MENFESIIVGKDIEYIDSDGSILTKTCISKAGNICTFKYKDEFFNTHRLDGPAIESIYISTNSTRTSIWYNKDKRHRIDGPAYIFVDENGRYRYEYYYNGNKFNNLDEIQDLLLRSNLNDILK